MFPPYLSDALECSQQSYSWLFTNPFLVVKVKISIRLDADLVDHFMAEAEKFKGQVGYQTLINDALRRSIDGPTMAELVRQAVREKFKAAQSAA
jgi:uncharacterized protein (DUF4415 family)